MTVENRLHFRMLGLIHATHTYLPREDPHKNHILQGGRRATVFQLCECIEGLIEEGKRHLEVSLVALRVTHPPESHIDDARENIDFCLCGSVHIDGRGCHLACCER